MFYRKRKAKDAGLYLGKLFDQGRVYEEVRYNNSIHASTIGPNGSGKGTGLIVPNLANLKRSIFIIDPKAEALAITCRARAKLGRVLIISPFNVLADMLAYLKSHGYNNLTALDPRHDNFTEDCVGIGQALVKEEPGNNGAFFGGSAQDFVCCAVMQEEIENGPNANLANVRSLALWLST